MKILRHLYEKFFKMMVLSIFLGSAIFTDTFSPQVAQAQTGSTTNYLSGVMMAPRLGNSYYMSKGQSGYYPYNLGYQLSSHYRRSYGY